MSKYSALLQEISPDKIKKNPENPRLIFRENEMNELLESIKTVGIKVPITVYFDGPMFTILDGERRWRCARKLNMKTMPAIVQPKPTPLENLLMMFNIHNVRKDWDLMPMALKLGQIKEMLQKEGRTADPKELAAVTGVRLTTVKRALDLLALPSKYRRILLKEAEKPVSQQRITPDLFIEVYKSMHAIERHTPDVFDKVTKAKYVDVMVSKYNTGVIDNVVSYRNISKIARAELAGLDNKEVSPVILKLVEDKKYSIKQAYEDTVQGAYEQRDLQAKLKIIHEKLSRLRPSGLNDEMRSTLRELKSQINRLLE